MDIVLILRVIIFYPFYTKTKTYKVSILSVNSLSLDYWYLQSIIHL